jgi:hypothetical protein
VANTSIAIGTRRLYGSGILVFNVYCDRIGVDDYGRIPASNAIMLGFVASLAGSYSQGTISSYVSGVRFWHQVHGIDWLGVDAHINREIHGTGEHAPEKSKRKLRLPVLPAHLVAIRQQLDLTSPLDAAVWACACCAFWAVARLGELVVRRLPGFDPAIHPARRHVTLNQLDRSGHDVDIIHLPSTKTHQNEGEDIYFAARPMSGCCPREALTNHLRVNPADDGHHVFAYTHKGSIRPLTRTAFEKRLRDTGVELPTGHGFRIGGTLEYLLSGLPFGVMKVKGRWASDAFEKYLRKHAEVMAPYMQEHSDVLSEFSRLHLHFDN